MFLFFWGLLVAGFCRILAIWILLVFIPARYSSPLGSSVARYDFTLFCSECNFLILFTWTGLCKEYMLGVLGHKKIQCQTMEREVQALSLKFWTCGLLYFVEKIRFICKHATKYFPIKVIFEDENAFDASRSYGEFDMPYSTSLSSFSSLNISSKFVPCNGFKACFLHWPL